MDCGFRYCYTEQNDSACLHKANPVCPAGPTISISLFWYVIPTLFSELPKYPFAHPDRSADPPAELKKLREQGSIHRLQLFDGTVALIVTRHKEVCEMLESDKFSNVNLLSLITLRVAA
ncbi:hypothetical protein BDW75DRAFT_8177 [Aspergillus navahoensis]